MYSVWEFAELKGKKVKIITTNKKEFVGFLIGYSRADDEEDNKDHINIKTSRENSWGYDFAIDEILSYEVVTD